MTLLVKTVSHIFAFFLIIFNLIIKP